MILKHVNIFTKTDCPSVILNEGFIGTSKTNTQYMLIHKLFNKTMDRNNALNEIAYVQPYCPNTELVVIVLTLKHPLSSKSKSRKHCILVR